MKKILDILALTLAVNFLALAGAAGWLWKSGKLDPAKVEAIREIVFPTSQPATQPADAGAKSHATTQPFVRLDALLEKHAGKRAGEQVEVIQQTFDVQSAMLDRRRRELDALQSQVATEQERLAEASEALEADRKRLADRDAQAQSLAADKGFQDSLKLYGTMQAKQAKGVFLSMPDDTVVRYLQAMNPRIATKILREFKAPDEQVRLNRLMELMREAPPPGAASGPATQPAGETAGGPDIFSDVAGGRSPK